MTREIAVRDIDVLVVGGGIAGTFAAIKAKEAGANKVVEIDKAYIGKSGCSAFAAGSLHVYDPEIDDRHDQFRRIVRGLGYLIDQDILSNYFELVPGVIGDMESFGVEFLRTSDGKLQRVSGRGGNPFINFRGPQLMDAIGRAALKRGVEQLHSVMITDLLTRDGQVVGAVGFHTRTGDFYLFESKGTILATGLTWYKGFHASSSDCTGDGYAAAYRAGATLGTPDCVDVANCFSKRWNIGPGMAMYQGQGGKFINAKGERFMEGYNPSLKDRSAFRTLIPALALEVERGNAPVYMDMTHFTSEQIGLLRAALPLAMKMYERVGLLVRDKFVEPIEWVPTAPIGRVGVITNRQMESSLLGLYACGEATAAQVIMGGMAFAAVTGVMAGKSAAQYAKRVTHVSADQSQIKQKKNFIYAPLQRKDGIEPDQVILSVQEAITPYNVIILRRRERMEKALEKVKDIRDNQVPLLCAYDPHYLRIAHEASNMAFVAQLHLAGAIFRTESRHHVREDYPYTDNINWLKWLKIKDEDGKPRISTRDVPIEAYPVKPQRKKFLAYVWQRAQELGIITIDNGEVIYGHKKN